MKEDIIQKVLDKICLIKHEPEKCVKENFDSPLTGDIMQFSSHDLVYLLLELMDEFGIAFVKDDVENYKFNTVNDIVDIIYNKICKLS